MNLIKCPMCNNEISPNAISCPICGEPLPQENSRTIHIINNGTKSICLVCKGRGKVRSPTKILLCLFGLVLIWTAGQYFVLTGRGQSSGLIFCTIAVLSWGFSRSKCKVCNGTGTVNL